MAMTLLLKRSPTGVGALEAGGGSGGAGMKLELTTQGGEATEVVRWVVVVVMVVALEAGSEMATLGTGRSGSGSCTCTGEVSSGEPPLTFSPAETTQHKASRLVNRYPPCPPLQASLDVFNLHP